MGYAFFDAKVLGLVAMVPATELGEGEEDRDDDEEDCRIATGGGALSIGCFGFG